MIISEYHCYHIYNTIWTLFIFLLFAAFSYQEWFQIKTWLRIETSVYSKEAFRLLLEEIWYIDNYLSACRLDFEEDPAI